MFGLLDTTTKSTTTRSPIGRPVAALLAAGLMTAAVGCSSDGDPASESADVESTEPSATRSTEQDRGSGDIDEPPADADSAAGDDSTGREVSDDIGGTRIVEHPGGVTEVPVGIDSILALDEPSAAVLMELGTPPDVIYGSYLTASTPLLADELGIEFLPHNIEDPSIEAAAALAPDLIVGTDHPGTLRNYDNWSEVAPVVLIDYAGAWQEQIATAGEAIGADDVAAARTAALETEIERVADRIAAEFDSAPSISVIASLAQMPFFVPEVGTASGELFRELGLTRPETQRVEGDPAFPVEF
ncbi:MAG: ABC transporter substrate-binding protein, partial [Actinomycetota bacterium]